MFRFGKGIVKFVLGSFILGLVTMLLWNALIPDIFHGPEIGYWQAVGLFVLAHVLTGGPRGGGHRGRKSWDHQRGWKKEWNWGGDQACGPRHEWRARFEKMTPEERQQMKSEWKAQWKNWKAEGYSNADDK